MWGVVRGVAVERFDVEYAECLVNVVGSHRCSSSVAHEPGSFLVFVSVMIIWGIGLSYLRHLVHSVLDVTCESRSHGIWQTRDVQIPQCPVGFTISKRS